MSDLNEIVPVENADARREMLSAQFDEAEAAPEPERAQPAEKPRDEVGKFAKAAPTEEKTEEDPVWRRPPLCRQASSAGTTDPSGCPASIANRAPTVRRRTSPCHIEAVASW